MDIHSATEGGLNHASASIREQQDPKSYVCGRDDARRETSDDAEDPGGGFSNTI
jgi:hypothetical protein